MWIPGTEGGLSVLGGRLTGFGIICIYIPETERIRKQN